MGNQNDIHGILSQLEEKGAVEVYNESPDQQPPEWLGIAVEEQKKDMDEAKLNEDEDIEGQSPAELNY
ncbi:hypothetical protein ACFOU2_19630 [Bacillus songklensis]|uniref:Uncharacterized protein n=1 Tax=Bacillus songklensis TaxID=1069116 RepID=A0ABV8B6Q2_9BACI